MLNSKMTSTARTTLRTMAIALSLAFLAMLLGTSRTAAQEATPVAAIGVDPANCTAEPIDTDHAATLMATPVASPELPLAATGVVSIPGGITADDQTVAAVESVISQLWSCNNARDKARVYGLFTDQALQETIGFTEGASWDAAELRGDVAAALTPGDPRAEEEWATVDSVISVTLYDDGQVGALILNTDPLVVDGDQVLDFFRFVPVEDNYMVSGVVLDPFDLTPGYGFEKTS